MVRGMRKKLAFGIILAVLTATPVMTSMAGQWINVNGAYWYKNENGSAYTGWLLDKGTWYYLDPSSGYMRTGWVLDNGKWYFLDRSSGGMQTGWVFDNGKWYYCYSDGSMCAGGWLDEGSKRYYLNADGAMAAGVFQVGYYRYRTNADGSIIRNRTKDGFRYDNDGCMMVRDENGQWDYLPPNEEIAQRAEERLRERYMEHEYANQKAFEKAVRDTFGGIWSETEIRSYITGLAEEFRDFYECSYNNYRY